MSCTRPVRRISSAERVIDKTEPVSLIVLSVELYPAPDPFLVLRVDTPPHDVQVIESAPLTLGDPHENHRWPQPVLTRHLTLIRSRSSRHCLPAPRFQADASALLKVPPGAVTVPSATRPRTSRSDSRITRATSPTACRRLIRRPHQGHRRPREVRPLPL